MIEQRSHRCFVAAHDGLMQRGKTGGRCIWIAPLSSRTGQFRQTGMLGEGRRADSQASASFTLTAATSFVESEITYTGREHQRGLASMRDGFVVEISVRRNRHHFVVNIRAQVQIRAMRQQHFHGVGCFCDSPHKRRLTARAMPPDSHPWRQQLDHGAYLHGRRPLWVSRPEAPVGIRTGVEKTLTMLTLPFWLAAQQGVAPRSLAAFTWRPP
jgi:hypothetical protein